MGRTGKSWVEIFFFYVIFYSLLAAFWASLLFLRITLLPEDTDGPLRTDYLTHRGPGMTLVPTGKDMKPDIYFNKDEPDTYQAFEQQMKDFFKEYTTIDGEDQSEKFNSCADGGSCSASDGYMDANSIDVIRETQQGNETVNVTESYKLYNLMNLGDCAGNDENDFGYKSGEPCLLFTVNKVFEWMPDELSEERKEKHPELAEVETSDKFVTFYCQGYKAEDRKMIESVTIYPKFGFQRDYFPWVKQEYFRQPVVAAKIKVTPEGMGKRIRMECKIYADNIHGDAREKPNIGRIEVNLKVSANEEEENTNNGDEENTNSETVETPDNNEGNEGEEAIP